MNRKITGWMMGAAAAVFFGPGLTSNTSTTGALMATAEDGSSPTPPPYIRPAPGVMAATPLEDGSSPTPPPYIPPAQGNLVATAWEDGSSPTPPPYIPPSREA
ncbi:MAG: hypothetical protein WA823_06510 [Candidatus Acidiferrales bacterium]